MSPSSETSADSGTCLADDRSFEKMIFSLPTSSTINDATLAWTATPWRMSLGLGSRDLLCFALRCECRAETRNVLVAVDTGAVRCWHSSDVHGGGASNESMLSPAMAFMSNQLDML